MTWSSRVALNGLVSQNTWAAIAQSGWTVRGSNPGGGEIFRTSPDLPFDPPSLLYNGYRVFPGGKAAGAWRWPPTHIYRRGYRKSRAVPLLHLWAFEDCCRLTFTFTCIQGRIKLFGAPRQWKHFRPLFQAVFLSSGVYYTPSPQTVKHHASQSQDRNNKYFILYIEFCINNKI